MKKTILFSLIISCFLISGCYTTDYNYSYKPYKPDYNALIDAIPKYESNYTSGSSTKVGNYEYYNIYNSNGHSSSGTSYQIGDTKYYDWYNW